MCLIILGEKGARPERPTIERMLLANPHGVGIMWARAGRRSVVQVQQWLSPDVDTVWDAVRNVAAKSTSLAIHARLATHGTRDLSNVHPFEIGGGAYLMHNGILDMPAGGTLSDTAVFALILREGFHIQTPEDFVIAADAFGHETFGSRLLAMFPGGEVVTLGNWHYNPTDRCLYSAPPYTERKERKRGGHLRNWAANNDVCWDDLEEIDRMLENL